MHEYTMQHFFQPPPVSVKCTASSHDLCRCWAGHACWWSARHCWKRSKQSVATGQIIYPAEKTSQTEIIQRVFRSRWYTGSRACLRHARLGSLKKFAHSGSPRIDEVNIGFREATVMHHAEVLLHDDWDLPSNHVRNRQVYSTALWFQSEPPKCNWKQIYMQIHRARVSKRDACLLHIAVSVKRRTNSGDTDCESHQVVCHQDLQYLMIHWGKI